MMRFMVLMSVCLLLVLPAMGEKAQVSLYTPPVNLRQSEACRVYVDGSELKLIDAGVNYQRTWAANPILTGTVPFGIFELDGTVTVAVEVLADITEAVVRPLSLGIVPHIDGRVISFVLSQPGPVTVEWNGDYKNALHIFVHPPEKNRPDKDAPDVLYFGPGVHDVGVLEPKSGQTVYLAGGCVLLGAIQAEGRRDIKVMGRGIISGAKYDRWRDTVVPINFSNCRNITIEGVTIIEPAAWCLNLYKSRDVTVKGVNIIGWCSNSDGITIQSCENVRVEGCFIRSWDDSLVVKGYDGDCRDIVFRNCVLWTDLAQSCEIGYETRAEVMEQITFEDITILHNFHKPAMSVHNSDHALVRDILFRNITVEDAQMGEGDGARLLIELTTTKSQWSRTPGRGIIRGVAFENISVLSGKECSIRIFSFSKDSNIDEVTFSNLNLLGRHITSLDQLRMNVNNRNGKSIMLLDEPAQVAVSYPGHLHTYNKARATVSLEAGLTLSASAFVAPYIPGNAADGNLNSYWEGTGQGEDTLTIQLSELRNIRSLTIYLNPAAVWGKREQTFSVLGSSDAAAYRELLPPTAYVFDPADGNSVTVEVSAENILSMRLVFIDNTGAPGGQIAEIGIE